jgi:hypothetical protein
LIDEDEIGVPVAVEVAHGFAMRRAAAGDGRGAEETEDGPVLEALDPWREVDSPALLGANTVPLRCPNEIPVEAISRREHGQAPRACAMQV